MVLRVIIRHMSLYKKNLLIVCLVFVLALSLRLQGLGSFMTVDEANWMLRSAGFWHAMWRDWHPRGTFMTTHPGATLMWIAGGGIFGQESRLGIDIDTSNTRLFRLAALLPVAAAVSAMVAVCTWLLTKIAGLWPAAWAGIFLAADPYFVGMSQVVHLDALLAIFMLAGLLSYLVARRNQALGNWVIPYLITAGVFTGLALATKFLPALWLLVFFGGHILAYSVRNIRQNIGRSVRIWMLIAGTAACTLYIAWPTLWISDDISRSFVKDVASVVTQEHIAVQESAEPIAPASFYARTLLGRTTPFVVILALAVMVASARGWRARPMTPDAIWLALFALGFFILITLAAKKADRYALPALLPLAALAGWGVGSVISYQLKIKSSDTCIVRPRKIIYSAAAALWLLVIIQTAVWAPYTIAYNSPLFEVRSLTQQGWGEGLDGAARWLNSKPGASELTIASWYPSVMQTFFEGKTLSLSSRDDHRTAYVVTYRNMGAREPDDIATAVLHEFRDVTPEYIVAIGGEPYARIYETISPYYFPQHSGELLPGMEVGQTVVIHEDGWSALDIALANFGRANTSHLIMSIRNSADSSEDLRTATIDARAVADQDWTRFTFNPIAGSAGRTYYVALRSEDASAGNAVAVRYTGVDRKPGEALIRRRQLQPAETNSSFFRAGDIGYRLPRV